ncbi:hypothetical protein EVAR_97001_1 [Eumeta japonica]|uniref:Uncharacterized protein n=1 Tax=Eumeta variegata TaxID=151549 RepID=A0A4C1ZXB6_EUMVA|nr:hypothetical protein EVAR_97001_1 [Eumeta japonica]
MELIEVIKRAQMETHDSEFSPFLNVMLIMNQGHRPPDHIDHKHRSVNNIAKVKDTRLNMDRKPQAVGSIAMDTRHTRIIDQKPRPLKAAVGILRLFQTGKTILFILMRYHQLTQMQQICLRVMNY